MRLIRLILILALVLTGNALASARGQTWIGERVVLCSGHAIVVVYGPDGAPLESPYFCPDMAISLMAAIAAPKPDLRCVTVALPLVFMPFTPRAEAISPVPAQARDPPLVSPA